MDFYDARNKRPRWMEKKKKKKSDIKFIITSVSENSVNVPERKNAPFLDFNFLKQSRGQNLGMGYFWGKILQKGDSDVTKV